MPDQAHTIYSGNNYSNYTIIITIGLKLKSGSRSHTSKFNNTSYCKSHKGKVDFNKKSFTSASENILLRVKI